jgi:uncharacterized membrane protein
MNVTQLIENLALALEVAGVGALVVGAVIASFRYLVSLGRRKPESRDAAQAYRTLRRDLGRAILLGLEFLVGGDIIRTVAITPTLQSVLVLALIVLVRTFLSWSLEVEIEGVWPWRRLQAQSTLGAAREQDEM